MIIAETLSKSYGKIKALEGVSLDITQGEICGILGPNGAGKTTLFKILCGLITPDSGEFRILSTKQKSIGAIIEKPAHFEYLSAAQNLIVLSRIQGASSDKKTINKLIETVGLSPDRKDAVKNFSLGMKQRLGLATALINDPDCLILDEPFLGLDPVAMNSLVELIKLLAKEKGLAILISSHLLGELTRTCDTLKVIQAGKIIQSGSTTEILEQSTKKFMVCGKQLEKSMLLSDMNSVISNGCASLDLEVPKAPDFLRSIISEGIDVTYFGPEINLNELYGEA